MNPQVEAFLDPDSETYSYVIYDQAGGHGAVIDPVLNLDYKSGRTCTKGAEKILEFLNHRSLSMDWILETHAHADHLSAAQFILEHVGGKIATGEHICEVQKIFSEVFNFESGFAVDGRQFDHLFADGDQFTIGELNARAIYSPGHTPADQAYLIGDALFVGDTLFMPDVGTARCDFPGGDARRLYQSIQHLLGLPGETRIFVCHDNPGDNRDYQCQTSVADQRQHNIHVHNGVSEDEFVKMRTERDATLQMPRLFIPSVQVNIRAGHLPTEETNGVSYLKVPVNML